MLYHATSPSFLSSLITNRFQKKFLHRSPLRGDRADVSGGPSNIGRGAKSQTKSQQLLQWSQEENDNVQKEESEIYENNVMRETKEEVMSGSVGQKREGERDETPAEAEMSLLFD